MYAGFWRRFAAITMDSFIFTLIFYILQILLLIFVAAGVSPALSPFKMMVAGIFCMFILPFLLGVLYFAGFESSKFQATPGKLIVGIKVVDSDGGRISFLNALGRYLCKFITTLTFGAGWAMAGLTEHKQALHDKIAGTFVIVRHDAEGERISPNLASLIYIFVVFINLLPFIAGFVVYQYIKRNPDKFMNAAMGMATKAAMSRAGGLGAMGAAGGGFGADAVESGSNFPGAGQYDFDNEFTETDLEELRANMEELKKLNPDFEKSTTQAVQDFSKFNEESESFLQGYSDAVKQAADARALLESVSAARAGYDTADGAKEKVSPPEVKQKQARPAQAQQSHGVTIVPKKKQDYISTNQNGMIFTTCVKTNKMCCYGAGCEYSGIKVAEPSKCCN